MTELQILRARALAQCTFLPGHDHKRFACNMAAMADNLPNFRLTPKQAEHLSRLAWRYRRQMPKPLVPAQDPDTLIQTNVTEGLGANECDLPLTTDD